MPNKVNPEVVLDICYTAIKVSLFMIVVVIGKTCIVLNPGINKCFSKLSLEMLLQLLGGLICVVLLSYGVIDKETIAHHIGL